MWMNPHEWINVEILHRYQFTFIQTDLYNIHSDLMITTPNHLKVISGNGLRSGYQLVTIATTLMYHQNIDV